MQCRGNGEKTLLELPREKESFPSLVSTTKKSHGTLVQKTSMKKMQKYIALKSEGANLIYTENYLPR